MSDINQLRSILFDTLQDLRNPDSNVDLDRVQKINDTAKNILDSAKVEVDFMRVTGARGTGFIGAPVATPPPVVPSPQGVAGQLAAASNVTTHKLRG